MYYPHARLGTCELCRARDSVNALAKGYASETSESACFLHETRIARLGTLKIRTLALTLTRTLTLALTLTLTLTLTPTLTQAL